MGYVCFKEYKIDDKWILQSTSEIWEKYSFLKFISQYTKPIKDYDFEVYKWAYSNKVPVSEFLGILLSDLIDIKNQLFFVEDTNKKFKHMEEAISIIFTEEEINSPKDKRVIVIDYGVEDLYY